MEKIIELKAMAYDLIAKRQQIENQLAVVNREIAKELERPEKKDKKSEK